MFVSLMNNNMSLFVVLVLLFLEGIRTAGNASFTIAIANNNINAVSNYTWTISLSDSSTIRTWMMFTFPTSVTLSSTSSAFINGSPISPFSNSSNSLNLSTSSFTMTSPLTVVITNVTNPYSALNSVTSFFYISSFDTLTTLLPIRGQKYISGTLNSCTWSFNQCTEQTGSMMTVALSTVNPLPFGSSLITIGFPAVWQNHNQKSILFGATTLSCSMSINGAANISASCSNPTSSNTITVSYSLNASTNGNDAIVVYIQGVMSPPTVTTPSNTLYTTYTSDTLGNIIDGVATGSSCSIQPVCATNYSNGVFDPITLPINTVTTYLQVTFNSFPTITYIVGDTIVFTTTQPSKIGNCSTFKMLRNNHLYDMGNNSTQNVAAYYILPNSNLPDNDYGYSTSIYMECSTMQSPQSETPMTLFFTFMRNAAEYMQLSGTFTATATALNASNASLLLSNLQMAAANTTYTFSFKSGQPLGTAPSFVLTFPTAISLTGVSCSIGVNSGLSPVSCISNSSNLIISYSGSPVSSGSSISIQVSGITNPTSPINYTFGITTYYNASVSTSRVQYNSVAFAASYTAITNLPVTLTPATFSVYTFTSINISFTCPLTVPSLSTFALTFPTDVTQIIALTQPLLVNGSSVLLTANPLTANSTVTFSNGLEVLVGSNIIITLSIRTPTSINTFPSIQLAVTQNNATLFQSLTSMPVRVTTPGLMPVSIVPYYSLTGASSPYLVTLTLTIPHPANFTVQIDAGSDTKFVSGGASCTSICSAPAPVGTNGLSFTVSNPSANSLSPFNIDLNISSFVNSRNIGPGLSWNISTSNLAGDPISLQTGYPTISVPNLLYGALLPTEFYYRNNTSTVKVQLNLTNLLQNSEYVLFTMDRSTYTVNTNVSCSITYGFCSLETNISTTNLLAIKVIPNNMKILANPLQLWIEGLISGANTYYLQTDLITVGTYSTSGNLIDQGKIEYNISCRDSATLSKSCKTCSNGSCLDCYLTQGYFLNGTSCVTSCGDASNYLSFANSSSGTCQSCSGSSSGCMMCINSSACMTCLNSSYYLYPTLLTCSLYCANTSGFISTILSGINVCILCADANCLSCTTTGYGSCIQCANTSILISGICSSTCLSPSYFVLNANCVKCDSSCYTCFAADNRSCTLCSIGYYNSSGVCSNSCPNGTAIILSNGTCGCASACFTCDSHNFANCTSCNDNSLFVYNGQCVTSCPNSSYLLNTTCIACSTGCTSCSTGVCVTCQTGWYIYNNKCYSDCNLISQQFDSSNLTCILCPTGCDTCSNGACSSCLTDYSLLSSSCIKTCQLTSSCSADTSNVVPLPGSIALFVWCGVVIIVNLFSHKNYIPYSIIIFSSFVEFILIIVVISQSNNTVGRLLTYLDPNTKNVIVGLLAFSLAINYISNAIYLYLFVRYIKPLIVNPKQIDLISHVVIIIIAMITNYRFAMIAYAKMFPKPSVHIEMSKNLTPIHYLCLGSVIFSIFPVIAAGIGLSKQQKLSSLFMLSLDLMIIVIFNILITFWFILSKKDDSYFEDEQKKEYTSQNMDINITKENIIKADKQADKDASDVNMIVSMHDSEKNSQESDQYDFGETYKKFKAKKTKITGSKKDNTILIKNNMQGKEHALSNQRSNQTQKYSQRLDAIKKSPQRNIFAIENEYQPENPHNRDVNFQQRVQKRGMKKLSHQMSRATTLHPSRPELIQQPALKSLQIDESKFNKQLNLDHVNRQQTKKHSETDSNIDANEQSFHKMESHLSSININSKQHLPKSKRNATNNNTIGYKKQLIKSLQNQTAMRKDKNRRYTQANSNTQKEQSQNGNSEDIAAIIKFKIQQSSIRKSQNITVLTNEQNDLQEISPSYYNVQNQRFYIEDIETSQQSQQ